MNAAEAVELLKEVVGESQDCDGLYREALEHLIGSAEELRAVKILDAWAKKHEEATPPTAIFHRYLGKGDGPWDCWTIALPRDGRVSIERFSSAAKARFAAAQALVAEDPSLASEVES